jgi:hypothetical protein
VALIRTDVSEDRIASIFRVYEYKYKIIIVTAVETSNLTQCVLLEFKDNLLDLNHSFKISIVMRIFLLRSFILLQISRSDSHKGNNSNKLMKF